MFTCCLDDVVITCKHIADWCGLSFQINSEEELLGSPTALELEQEISESQAVHQNLLDYSEQADSLILSEDMDRQSEWSRDQLSILDENLSYYTTCADIVKRIHTGGPAESKKLPKFPPLPKKKAVIFVWRAKKKTKDDDTGRTSPVLDNKRDRCNQNCKKRSLSLFDITTPDIAVAKLKKDIDKFKDKRLLACFFSICSMVTF
ncbi:unnamed protein product [Mytilus coruscus]|uniref:Uncharacterized protein n=1 Tax=Mytilus coruscus TaxID=42192 RepID=A0A6J8BYD3_MYTCO|nr:unnamed protein product [Mytilus coruscus]